MTQEFVTLPREVVELALEAMKWAFPNSIRLTADHRNSIDSLRAALEQPQAEQPAMTPIAQRKLDSLLAEGYTISGYSVYHERKHQHGFVTSAGLVGWWKPEGVGYPQPRGEQEPVGEAAFMPGAKGFTVAYFLVSDVPVGTKLYTHSQPKREPLTNEQVKVGLIQSIECTDARERCAFNIGVRFAERAHNIK